MKLLLTSNGLCNKSIVKALADLLEKPFSKSKLAFIPTAANVEAGNKSWVVNDLKNCDELGWELLDIVDFSALDEDMWKARLGRADVLFFGGGNTFHLMYQLKKLGLDKLLPEMLKNKVYAGFSAGSMVSCPSISLAESKKLYYPELNDKYEDESALGLVKFLVKVHLNSDYFPNVNVENLTKIAKDMKEPIYAIDDESALKVVDGKVEIISEGKHAEFNL